MRHSLTHTHTHTQLALASGGKKASFFSLLTKKVGQKDEKQEMMKADENAFFLFPQPKQDTPVAHHLILYHHGS